MRDPDLEKIGIALEAIAVELKRRRELEEVNRRFMRLSGFISVVSMLSSIGGSEFAGKDALRKEVVDLLTTELRRLIKELKVTGG